MKCCYGSLLPRDKNFNLATFIDRFNSTGSTINIRVEHLPAFDEKTLLGTPLEGAIGLKFYFNDEAQMEKIVNLATASSIRQTGVEPFVNLGRAYEAPPSQDPVMTRTP